MDDDVAKLIRDVISNDRLQPYVDACHGNLVHALRLYAWNLEACAALHGPLSVLEVACRNALHRQLATLFGCEDWWNAATSVLDPKAVEKIGQAHEQLRRQKKTLAPGRIVAELSFGFWVALLRRDYEMSLWRPAVHGAFPAYRGKRAPVHGDLRNMVILRNRIAHHEPIHHRDLVADQATINRLIAYISPEAADWARRNSRVKEVLSRRQAAREGQVPTRF